MHRSVQIVLALVVSSGCCTSVRAHGPAVETVAGTGAAENNGNSGPASVINIGQPFGVEIGPDRALYITEVLHHRVRRLDFSTREITTVAGCGRRGYSGDGGPAIEAELNEPYEVRFDRDGNMYVVEMRNHVVRRIDKKSQRISTVAGIGRPGFGGDGGPATQALLNQPHSIAIGHDDAIYIADIGNHRIRRVDPKTGIIESAAGNSQPLPPRDGQTACGNPILGPRALFTDGDSLWVALREGHSIWRLGLADGVLHHVAGTGEPGFAGDHGPALQAKFNGPKGIAVLPNQYIFVVDSGNNAIRRIDLRSAQVTTIADNESRSERAERRPGAPANASLNQPHGLCVAPDGSVFIGDTMNNRVLRVE